MPNDTSAYPPEARARLGRLIELARTSATPYISQRKIAGQTETYQRLRDGLVVQAKTLRAAEKALGWAMFACDDLLGGAAEPRLATPGEPRDDEAVIVRRAYEQAGEIMEGLAGATPEERQQIAEILARARERGRNRPN